MSKPPLSADTVAGKPVVKEAPEKEPPEKENPEFAYQKAKLELRKAELFAEIQIKADGQLNKVSDQLMALENGFADKRAPLKDARAFQDGEMDSDIGAAKTALDTAKANFTRAETALKEAKATADDLERRRKAAERMAQKSNLEEDLERLEAEETARETVLQRKRAVAERARDAELDAAKSEFDEAMSALKAKYNIKD